MSTVNKVILVANLCADPEVRMMSSGKPVVNLRVATNERWKDKATGERRDKAEYHNVVIFNEHLAKTAENYLKKGSKVYLEGSLQTRKWTDQSGVDKYSTEIVLQNFTGVLTMLDSRSDGGQQGGYDDSSQAPTHQQHQAAKKPADDLDDEIPF